MAGSDPSYDVRRPPLPDISKPDSWLLQLGSFSCSACAGQKLKRALDVGSRCEVDPFDLIVQVCMVVEGLAPRS